MADNTKDIIKQFGLRLTKDIKKAIPVATGKTRDSVYIEFTKTGFIIRGGARINSLTQTLIRNEALAIQSNIIKEFNFK